MHELAEGRSLADLVASGIRGFMVEKSQALFAVQELAEGRSLADLVASGWRADEAEVARIAHELLEVRAQLLRAPAHAGLLSGLPVRRGHGCAVTLLVLNSGV